MQISPFDFAIIVLYLAGITLFGARFRRGQQTTSRLFSRRPHRALVGASRVPSSLPKPRPSRLSARLGSLSPETLVFLQMVLGYLVARVILCVVLIPQYFQGEFYTAYQLLEKRFGTRMKSAAAVVFLGTRALAEGVRISAIGKVVSVAFGTGDRVSIAIVAAAHHVLHVRRRHARGDLDRRDPVRPLPHGFGRGVFALSAQNSRRLARR